MSLLPYTDTYLQKSDPRQNLKDSILNENPIPINITKPRKLDEYYKELLEENRAKRELAVNGALEKIQSNLSNMVSLMIC